MPSRTFLPLRHVVQHAHGASALTPANVTMGPRRRVLHRLVPGELVAVRDPGRPATADDVDVLHMREVVAALALTATLTFPAIRNLPSAGEAAGPRQR